MLLGNAGNKQQKSCMVLFCLQHVVKHKTEVKTYNGNVVA